MKRSRIRRLIVESGGENLAPEILELIRSDKELQAELDKVQSLRQLLSLKNYEQPDEAFEERSLYRIKTRLENLSSVREPWSERLWESLAEPTRPTLRHSLVAVFVCLLGINLFTFSHNPSSSSVPMVVDSLGVSAVNPIADIAETNESEPSDVLAEAEPILLIASNTQPGRVRGPNPNVRFVDY